MMIGFSCGCHFKLVVLNKCSILLLFARSDASLCANHENIVWGKITVFTRLAITPPKVNGLG